MPRSPRAFRLAGTVASLTVALCAIVAAGRSHPTAVPVFGGNSSQEGPRQREMRVSVVDRAGVPITDLSAREFVVREDGVAREVLSAERADDPITLALLVDNSQAAGGVVSDVRQALTAFVRQLGGRNPVAVTTFGERPTILQDYTLVVPEVVRGIERIFPIPGSGAYLLQALKEVATGFARRTFERGTMVVITTEGPEFSDLDDRQVVPLLRDSGASLHAFVFQSVSSGDLGDPSVRYRAAVLDEGPRVTGGRRVDLLSSMSINAALKTLAAQLANEYRISYARPDTLVPPEKIEVSVKRPGLDTRGTPVRPKRG